MKQTNAQLSEQAKNIKLVVFDVDGVFTDGKLQIANDGQEYKTFHTQDGLGIVLLLKTGIDVAVISGLHSQAVEDRMAKLGVKHIFMGHPHKVAIYEQLLAQLGLVDAQVAYMGDDLPDLPLIRRACLGVTVANASHWVKAHAQLETLAFGGSGAVREFCEWLMAAQGHLDKILATYL